MRIQCIFSHATVLLAAVCALFNSAAAVAATISVAVPMQQLFRKSEVVAHVRLKELVSETYVERSESLACGATFRAEVLKSYKGKLRQEISFTANSSELLSDPFLALAKGDELLVFLARRHANQAPYSPGLADIVQAPPAKAKVSCWARLSEYTPAHGYESAFYLASAPGEDPGQLDVWLLLSTARTEISEAVIRKNTSSSGCVYVQDACVPQSRRVRWGLIEKQLLKWGGE